MAQTKTTTDNSTYESILKRSATEKTSFFHFSKVYPAYITLLITLAVSFGLWQLVKSQIKNENTSSFDKAATSIMNRFEDEYNKNYQVLISVSGLYDELVQVVRDYFNLYASIPTKTSESLLGVIYSPKVSNDELELYYYNIRSQGLWEYVIHPGGIRDNYYPIQFIVPNKINSHLSGFDLGTVPVIKKSIFEAIEKNEVIATPVFEFRKDTSAFFIISPIYKKGASLESTEDRTKNYEGSVILEINSDMFFQSGLGGGNESDSSVIFQIFNAEFDGKKDIIFESSNAGLLHTDYKPELIEKRILKIADKDITIEFSTVPDFGGQFQKFAPLLTLIISLLLSFFAFAFILNVINRKQSALNLAERMTRSQRRIVESSNDIIAVMDLDGYWKSMNPASLKILNYQPDELINRKIDQLFLHSDQTDEFYNLINEPSENLNKKIDLEMLSKDGDVKWISMSLSVSRIEGLIYCTGRDVTLEKIAEEQDKIRNKQIMLAEQLSREANEFKSSFFAKFSLQLRNSLTGILGYIELISLKAYENEEEHDSYIAEATKSSHEILNFISKQSDSWKTSEGKAKGKEKDTLRMLTATKLGKPLNDAFIKFNKEFNKDNKIKIIMDDSVENLIAVVDSKDLSDTINQLLQVITYEADNAEIKFTAKAIDEEDITQIIINTPSNDVLNEMINLYDTNKDNLFDILKKDKHDIVLRLALIASKFRMINGFIKIHSSMEKGVEIIIELQNKIQQEQLN